MKSSMSSSLTAAALALAASALALATATALAWGSSGASASAASGIGTSASAGFFSRWLVAGTVGPRPPARETRDQASLKQTAASKVMPAASHLATCPRDWLLSCHLSEPQRFGLSADRSGGEPCIASKAGARASGSQKHDPPRPHGPQGRVCCTPKRGGLPARLLAPPHHGYAGHTAPTGKKVARAAWRPGARHGSKLQRC